ncbi:MULTISPECIES: outer membrane lipoprotein chaperone LolA [Caldimonas]|uniref:outer membrane lipoprotein chaperone LolA n=2 Tax=Caldimonas TaxID=196013 RepID=UPI0003A420B4|nr:outer membrane lipoprotein chaperone LolA [Caldimonas manganoxidans]MCX7660990.1 outer membrane lipoprotein chaperone LolA [Caldimonas manganoxidans]
MMNRSILMLLLGAMLAGPAWADALGSLRQFVQEVKSARAVFTQTVSSPEGTRKRSSEGRFEFVRPNRFRFDYAPPMAQTIVADGQKVWLYDPDLNQVTVRAMSEAVGATPAALLAGGPLDREFTLKGLPDRDGLQWVEAVPKARDSAFQAVRVGFRGKELAALEIVDGFGQVSVLSMRQFEANVHLAPERFRFTPPPGADVLEQ